MASPHGLAELVLPPRDAAQKASKSFAEQLSDSPGRSDGDSPGSSNPFREPAHRTKSVKYRYSATGKHLSSPLKGSPSSPARKPDKSKLKSLLTPPSHVPKPNPPAPATTSRKRKASPPPSTREEDLLSSSFRASLSPLSSVPTTPITSNDPLPLSSPLATEVLAPAPPKRHVISKSFSVRALAPTQKVSVTLSPLSSKRKQRKGKTNTKKDPDPWCIGNSVWVCVNESGMPADGSTPLELTREFMWWPAQIVQKQPLRVSLFGDSPSSSSTSRGLRTIFDPSPSNILSINDDSGAMRFSNTTFCLASPSTDDDGVPPAKRPRLDETESIQTRWESAVQYMDKASTLEQDGLPALLSSYATTGGNFDDSLEDTDTDASDLRQSLFKSTGSARKKSKLSESARKVKRRGSKAKIDDDANGATRSSSFCPPDPTLQIPGELVFALAPRTGGSYWPAQIVEHVEARQEKYRIRFLDDKLHVVPRNKFWTSEEEGFVRCALGEWESAVKTTDDPESGDEDANFGSADDATVLDDVPTLQPPPPPGDFEDLSVRAQLAYVIPVLRAILVKEYGPAREKHEAFLKGGSARVSLLKSAGVRGGMDVRFVKAVQKVICEWVLGEDVRSGVNETGGQTDPKDDVVPPAETLPARSTEDDKMQGIEGAVVEIDTISNARSVRDLEMAEVGHDQSLPTNGVAPSPEVQQATLTAKSQLDLLAEVSQAVATKPSLLPSHPDVSRLEVNLRHEDLSPQPSPLTPIPDEDPRTLPVSQRSGPIVCEDFEVLSPVEKLDYCLNILLPEAIQQLLLWRSGERTSVDLLSPEEEQRLHDIAARKAAETDWVDDLMRLREAQARLWGIELNKKAEGKQADVQGGTRSRQRRATVSRP